MAEWDSGSWWYASQSVLGECWMDAAGLFLSPVLWAPIREHLVPPEARQVPQQVTAGRREGGQQGWEGPSVPELPALYLPFPFPPPHPLLRRGSCGQQESASFPPCVLTGLRGWVGDLGWGRGGLCVQAAPSGLGGAPEGGGSWGRGQLSKSSVPCCSRSEPSPWTTASPGHTSRSPRR